MRFEWDEDKALKNVKKHRVSFEQAKLVFDDPRAVPFEDLEHSTSTRNSVCDDWYIPNRSIVCFIYIWRRIVRLISARRAENWMVKVYENED